jgi:hypothetical protein
LIGAFTIILQFLKVKNKILRGHGHIYIMITKAHTLWFVMGKHGKKLCVRAFKDKRSISNSKNLSIHNICV